MPCSTEIVLVEHTRSVWPETLCVELDLALVTDFDCVEDAEEHLAMISRRGQHPLAVIVGYPSPRRSGGKVDRQHTVLVHTHIVQEKTMLIFVVLPEYEFELRRLLPHNLTAQNITIVLDSEKEITGLVSLLGEKIRQNVVTA